MLKCIRLSDIMVLVCFFLQVDSQESSRQQRRAEILERLMSLYTGVVMNFFVGFSHSSMFMCGRGKTTNEMLCFKFCVGGYLLTYKAFSYLDCTWIFFKLVGHLHIRLKLSRSIDSLVPVTFPYFP